jgi:hypothetical protein
MKLAGAGVAFRGALRRSSSKHQPPDNRKGRNGAQYETQHSNEHATSLQCHANALMRDAVPVASRQGGGGACRNFMTRRPAETLS